MNNEISIENQKELSVHTCGQCRYFSTDQISIMCQLVKAEDSCCYAFESEDMEKENELS